MNCFKNLTLALLDDSECLHKSSECTKTQRSVGASHFTQSCVRIWVCMAHPVSPGNGILVDQNTSAGKTKVLITFLDQHYHDPRKNITVFPTKVLELLRLGEDGVPLAQNMEDCLVDCHVGNHGSPQRSKVLHHKLDIVLHLKKDKLM